MCTLHDFLSTKVRFHHASTVTRSDSCYGKNYAHASCTSCFFLKFTLHRCNSTLPGTWDKLKYNYKEIKSKFTRINMYLNLKCILTFVVVLIPKLSLIHENTHICNIHTLGDT